MSSRPTPLRSLLDASPHLRALLDRLRADQALAARVQGLLPPELAARVEGVRARDGTLVLLAASPVWATRLRFAVPTLRRALPEVGDIRVKVVPRLEPEGRIRRRARRALAIAVPAAQIIRSAAAAQADPELRAALLRLASHAQVKQTLT